MYNFGCSKIGSNKRCCCSLLSHLSRVSKSCLVMALSVLRTDRVSVSTATGAGARGAVAQKETLRTAAEKGVLSNHEFE